MRNSKNLLHLDPGFLINPARLETEKMMLRDLVFWETVLPRGWGGETRMFSIKQAENGQVTIANRAKG